MSFFFSLLQPDGTCISGQKSCQSTTPICNEDSCCADTTLAASLVTSEDACLKKCKTFPVVDGKECKWYSFVKDVRFCLLFSTTCKDKIDGGEGVCSSGDKNCPTGNTNYRTYLFDNTKASVFLKH